MKTLAKKPVQTTCRIQTRLQLQGEGQTALGVSLPVVGVGWTCDGRRFYGQLVDAVEANVRFERAVQKKQPAILVEKRRDGALSIRWSQLEASELLLNHKQPEPEGPWSDLQDWEHRFTCGQVESLGLAVKTSLEFGILSRFTGYFATLAEDQDKFLAARVVQAVEETFRMAAERKQALARQVARDLLGERGHDVETVDALLRQVAPAPPSQSGLLGPIDKVHRSVLGELNDQFLFADAEHRRELMVQALTWLDRLADVPALTAICAGLGHRGRRLLEQPEPKLSSWQSELERLAERLEAI